MKTIFLFLFISSAALANSAFSPIVKGGQKQQSYNGPKQPIVTLPSPPPAPLPPRPEPEEPKRDLGPRFWDVVSWFENGQDVKWSEIKGSYVGYCVPSPGFHSPWNQRRSYLLTYLPNAKGLEMLRFTSLGFGAIDMFSDDFLQLSPEQLRNIQDSMRRDTRFRSAGFKETPTVTQQLYYEDDRNPYSIEEYRRFGTMIVSRVRSLRHYYYVSYGVSELTSSGLIVNACYYTKKVSD